jgi:sec-independent protein translocase protein TatC
MLEELKPHLAELRKRLGTSIGVLFVMFFVMFAFWQPILEWMTTPLTETLPKGSSVVFTKIQEPFFTALKVAFFTGFMVSLPVIFWQLWMFVSPGLYDNEKKMVIPFVTGATLMFLIGASFAYYVVVPFGFTFLINFGTQLFTALPSIGEYVSFFTKLMIGFGLAFELPVITFFLASIGLITDSTLKEFFRYALVIIFLLSALLTPPDILTQFLMAGPMIFLYGVSIYIAKAVNPDRSVDDKQ